MPIPSDDDLTVAPAGRTPSPLQTASTIPARFAPGSIVAGRYRLVALVGRGGMGEVYRADDLTLDHPVALKFLPEAVAADPERLAQFHHELRIARQVSHKNVCRLYDLGEADGRRFLTMEYVDGEDLASLLRRIGRLPEDKAVDIARQLCAGLAAAHERGILHRDLKPANVMIDGDGNVRITDFGLAAADGDATAALAGTPQYMAPELVSHSGGTRARASIKTDLYALGLVLYEIFTGKRAYDAKTLEALRELHRSTPTTPSSFVRDLDPSIERAILRCLERDPARRPASALAVAAALPGGDPVAAALAAGETPSPQMLAAAGETDVIPVGRGLAAVACGIAGTFAVAVLAMPASVAGRVPLDKPPAVLVDRAQSIVRSLGYTDRPADEAFDFIVVEDYLRWIARTDASPHRWDVLSSGTPPALALWYRSSPRALVPIRHGAVELTPNDPPPNDTGMTMALVDTRGRLIEFHAVPPQFDQDTGAPPPARWSDLFDAAGLPLASFAPAASQWTPRDFADTRAAWEGPLPDRPDMRIRIEAASYRGRATSFSIIGPWSRPARMQPLQRSTLDSLVNGFFIVMLIASVAGSALLARHNIRLRRGDWRGATRLALVVVFTAFVEWTAVAHHVPDIALEFKMFWRAFQVGAAGALVAWILYVAIEPFGRRLWPDGLLGWTRLLAGYIRDPRVGRDVLIGALFGIALLLVGVARLRLPGVLGYPAMMPVSGDEVRVLSRGLAILGVWGDALLNAPIGALLTVFAFVVLRLALRRGWLAIAAGMTMLAIVETSNIATVRWLDVSLQLVIAALVTIVVVRFGLLAAVAAFVLWSIGGNVPFTSRFGHWSAAPSNLTVALFAAIIVLAFVAARGREPLFGRDLQDA